MKRAGYMGGGLALAMAAIALGGAAVPAAMAQGREAAARRSFDLPSQNLDDALLLFSRQSGVQISSDSALTASRRSAEVRGSMGAAEALGRLLTGTGLTFRFVGANAVRIEPAPQVSANATALGPVRVEGSTEGGAGLIVTSDANATEGDTAYVARAMSTATGLSLSPRQTPQSVSVITRAQLDNEAAITLTDALLHAPGIKVTESESWASSITVRGFDLDTMQVDGMNMKLPSQPGTFPFDMTLYDRVEVLRGAAGLTQGAGAPGGTINLVRKMPTTERRASVLARGGSWNDYRVEGDVSGALSGDGHLRARAVAAYQDSKSFVDYVNQKKLVLYGVLQADLGETTMVSVGVDWMKANGTPLSWGVPFYADGSDIRLPRSTFFGAPWNRRETDNTNAFVEIEQQLGGDWKAKLNAARIWNRAYNRWMMITGSSVDPVTNTGPRAYGIQQRDVEDQTVADLRVSGPLSLLGRQHELVLGANYQQTKLFTTSYAPIASWVNTRPNIRTFDPTAYSLPAFTPSSVSRTREQQGGFYGLLRVSLSEPLKIFAGARMNWWKYSYDYASDLYSYYNTYAISPKMRVIPYGGVTYDALPGTTFYVSYTDIYKPQNAIDRNGRVLAPVVGSNYEAGVKHGFAEDRLLASVALFRIEQTNRSLSDVAGPSPCPFNLSSEFCSIASGKVRSQGVDTELTGRMAQGWEMTLSYTLTTTKYLNGDEAGRVFNIYQPKHLVKFSTAYDLSGPMHWLTVGGSFYYQSRWRLDDDDIKMTQAPYALVDLMAKARISEQLSASVNVNNLFDKVYYKQLTHNRAYNWYGAPRNFMVTVQGKF